MASAGCREPGRVSIKDIGRQQSERRPDALTAKLEGYTWQDHKDHSGACGKGKVRNPSPTSSRTCAGDIKVPDMQQNYTLTAHLTPVVHPAK